MFEDIKIAGNIFERVVEYSYEKKTRSEDTCSGYRSKNREETVPSIRNP